MSDKITMEEHLAMAAAAYLDAANLHQSLWRETSAYKTDQIIKRTPADAQAALERVKREARNEGRREAHQKISEMWASTTKEHMDAILALMEDTDDDRR